MRIPVSAVAVLLIATLAAPTRATITSGNVTGAAANISGTATAAQFVGGGAGLTGVTDAGAATRLNAVAVATNTLQTEMYAVGASTTAIAAATTTLASTMFADFAAVGVSTTAIAASTTTLAASIVAEAAARAASDVTIGASTQTLAVAIAASTTTIQANVAAEATARAAQDVVIGASTQTLALAVAASTVSLRTDAQSAAVSSTSLASVQFTLGQSTAANAAAVALKVSKAGDTMTGALDMSAHKVTSVTDPTAAQDAATKAYVDANVNGLQYKASARLGTTTALPSNSYSNGSSGVGATITGLSLGLLTVDGVAPQVGDRLLVNNEGTPSHNGIYTVTVNAVGAFFILTRGTDHDQPAEMGSGTAVFVDSGTTNTDAGFVQTASVTTVGTDPVVFTQFNGLGSVLVTGALTKSGNTIGVNSSSVAVKNASGFVQNIDIDKSSFTAQGNTFNGASQLVQLTAATKYPALDGSLITNIPGVNTGQTPTVYPKAFDSTTFVPSFTSEVSSGVTVSSSLAIVGDTTFSGILKSSTTLKIFPSGSLKLYAQGNDAAAELRGGDATSGTGGNVVLRTGQGVFGPGSDGVFQLHIGTNVVMAINTNGDHSIYGTTLNGPLVVNRNGVNGGGPCSTGGCEVSNIPVFLSSQVFTAATSSTFSVSGATVGTVSGQGQQVDCDWSAIQNTATGVLRLIMSGDSAASAYSYSDNYGDNGAIANSADSTAQFCALEVTGPTAAHRRQGHLTYVLINQPGLPIHYETGNFAASNLAYTTSGSCLWVNGNTPVTLALYVTAGTMTGKVSCTVKQF